MASNGQKRKESYQTPLPKAAASKKSCILFEQVNPRMSIAFVQHINCISSRPKLSRHLRERSSNVAHFDLLFWQAIPNIFDALSAVHQAVGECHIEVAQVVFPWPWHVASEHLEQLFAQSLSVIQRYS